MGADYYKTLGISKDATEQQIKSAYKKVSLLVICRRSSYASIY